MGQPFLRTLLFLEVGILAGLFLLLVLWPVLRRLIRSRRRRQRDRLLSALRDRDLDDPARRVRAALSGCRPGVLLRVLDVLGEEDLSVEPPELRRLIRREGAFQQVERAAASVLWWRRQAAARLLSHLGRPDSDRELLVRLLRDPHPAVSTAALLSARELGWPSLAAPLLDIACSDPAEPRGEGELLLEALSALETDVVPLLEARLRSADDDDPELPLLRVSARVGDARLLPVLVERLRRGGMEVRIQAAKTLSAIGDRRAAGPLRDALEDPAWQVRTQAARALGEMGVRDAATDLRRALSDPSWWVRLRAALALRNLGERGREILSAADPADDRYAAEMAAYVLDLDEAALEQYGR